jgi:hypothetical protein
MVFLLLELALQLHEGQLLLWQLALKAGQQTAHREQAL